MEIRKLNTLRGIAALIVAISHYSNATNWLDGLLGRGSGQIGVMIFFILSGFLMSYLYMNQEFNREKTGKFALARAARVLPLYLIVVVASYCLFPLKLEAVPYTIPNLAVLGSHFLMLYGDMALWTIPAEIQFYAFFVLLWCLLSKKTTSMYVVIISVFIILMILDFPRPQGKVLGLRYDLGLLPALPYFFSGIVMGQLYKSWRPPLNLVRNIFASAIIFFLLLFPEIFFYLTGVRYVPWSSIGLWFSLSLVFFIIVFFVPDTNPLLANKIGDFTGKISYSVYLLHSVLLQSVSGAASDHPLVYLVIFLAGTIVISYISYRFIENPCRRLIAGWGNSRGKT